ncbi:uncharacterized protein LOC144123847 [Amblyomma americanum]
MSPEQSLSSSSSRDAGSSKAASKDDTSHAGAEDPGHQEQRPEGDGVAFERGDTSMFLSALRFGEPGCRTGTDPEESAEEENWELDIAPGNSGYIPSGHLYLQRVQHQSRRTRRRMHMEQAEDYKRREAERLLTENMRESLEGDKRQVTAEEESEHPRPQTSFVPVPIEEIEARTPWRCDSPQFGRADAALKTDYPIRTDPEESAEEENWELDIAPGNSGYIPSGHLYLQRVQHQSRRTRRRMHMEQAEDYKRREAERLLTENMRESLEGDKRQVTAEEESEHPRPRQTSFVPVPIEEIEARTPWRCDSPLFGRADAALKTDYPIRTDPEESVEEDNWELGDFRALGWSFAMGGPLTPAPQGTLPWLPYGTRIDSATNVLMPVQPAPGHQDNASTMIYAHTSEMAAILCTPACKLDHAPKKKKFFSYRGPAKRVVLWYWHYWLPIFPQAAAQQSEDAGVYAEGGALCDAPLESFAIIAEQLREHTVSKSGVSTPVGPPPEATAGGWQSAVLPEPASNDKHVPPPPASSDGSCPASSEDPGGSGGSRVCRRRYGGCIPAGRMDQGGACRPGHYYNPAKARGGRQGV